MQIRKTALNELELIRAIYDEARQYMRDNGNSHQWVNGYPSDELLKKDIAEGISYVCIDQGEIVGVFAFSIGEDETYKKIYDGQWLNEKTYGVIHRLGVSSAKKGVGTVCLDWCFQQIPNIRVDTHEANVPMQKLLMKNGYQKCGIIYVNDGTPRAAFQKTIDSVM